MLVFAVVIGGCACVCVCYCFEGGGGVLWLGRREAVFMRALTRSRAEWAGLPYMQHLREVTFHALRL